MQYVVYPPRPEGKIQPSQLSRLEKEQKYVVQRKFNGDRCLVHVENGQVRLFSRYGKPFDRYKTPSFLVKEILSLNLLDQEYWLDGELLNKNAAKTGVKNTIVLYDVLQAGSYLYGSTQMQRLELLAKIAKKPTELAEPAIALRVSDHVWMAETWDSGFESHFTDFITHFLVEGLVLRLKDSFLDNFGASEYLVKWLIRCRKTGSTYNF